MKTNETCGGEHRNTGFMCPMTVTLVFHASDTSVSQDSNTFASHDSDKCISCQ